VLGKVLGGAVRPTLGVQPIRHDLRYFIGDMMQELAYPVQQSRTAIEIRPFKGGWQCYEGPGVQPYWAGENAMQSATDYAKARAKFGHGQIRVLNADGSIKDVIRLDGSTRNYD
jgi:hypothetical protein